MKSFTAATVGAVLIGCIQSAVAFGPIANVDGWDADRLEKAGIKVHSWKHDPQSEDPSLEWVQVAFDCSSLPKKQAVLMTAWIVCEGKSAGALRTERSNTSTDTVALLFTVEPEYQPQSRFDMFIWTDTPDGGKVAHGYELSVKRIIELAREKTANKQVMIAPEDQQEDPNREARRVVRFPDNRSLGSLHVRDASVSWLSFEPWEPLGVAKGYVAVPTGKALLLDMTDRTDRHDFSFLASLQPQDLQALVLEHTNADILVVSRMNDLRWLLLAGTKIRDHDLSVLVSLSKLERLDLTATNVTDEGVIHLAQVDSLRDLTLGGDSITDESIPYLLKLHRLERLDLRGSGVSEEGAKRLENGLPNCRIQH